MRLPVRPALAAALLVLAACSLTTEPQDRLIVGTVVFYQDSLVVDVPESARVGEAFEVGIRTYGGGCEEMGPTQLDLRSDTVVVTPMERTSARAGVACTDILKTFDHRATITPLRAGRVIVRFRGRVEPGDTLAAFPFEVPVQ